ncbi:MAG: RsmB/NOP family class I SAM-dependent RNA methyltransferase [Verrucomicrobia bacterium]|nr:RsmB/NOP family class I SAM-dependent RNA methyltransferase [Verrucomicrobiota bacterium]
MSKTDKSLSSRSWQASVRVVEDFLKSDQKLDVLLERHSRNLEGDVARRVQFLSYGVVRHLGRFQSQLKSTTRKLPKKRLQAIMLVALFEYSEAEEGNKPQIVHYVVEQAKRMLSKPESKFANAVLRKLPELEQIEAQSIKQTKDLSRLYSHPKWLVDRWIELWGEAIVEEFLSWNQMIPKVYAFCRVSGMAVPDDWVPTAWPGFFEIQDAEWKITRTWLADGKAYIQDPSTRLGPQLLEGQIVRSALDLCAAPGGKSIQLLGAIHNTEGLLVSVDVPGSRFDRLRENLSRYQREGIEQVQVAEDVLGLNSDQLPRPEFDLVYVDVPCSNTGVLQRRPDIKWRQTAETLRGLIGLQEALLKKAAQFVKLDGWLIYSTCSVEPEENQQIIDHFLETSGGTCIKEKEILSFPWESGHDGVGAFLLRRVR